MRIALAGPLSPRALAPYIHPSGRSVIPVGIENPSVARLATGFADRGIEIVVVTLHPDVTDELVATGPTLRLSVGPYRRRRRARDFFRAEREYVQAALLRERPALVHAHWTYEYALGALATGLPTLVTVHDWAPAVFRHQATPYRGVQILMQAAALRRGRHFTAVSPYIQARLRRWARRSSMLVPNGLPESAFDPGHRALRQDRPVLLAVNVGFSRYKNVEVLLRAFELIRRGNPRIELWLVGPDYGHGEAAFSWARRHGLDAGVRFHGAVSNDHVRELMMDADVLVHPSLVESFSQVVLEAMATGLPVVAGARTGGVPWVLGQGHAGVLTDVRSPEGLAGAIQELLSDERRWAELSRCAYTRARSEFSLSSVLDRYWSLYTDIA